MGVAEALAGASAAAVTQHEASADTQEHIVNQVLNTAGVAARLVPLDSLTKAFRSSAEAQIRSGDSAKPLVRVLCNIEGESSTTSLPEPEIDVERQKKRLEALALDPSIQAASLDAVGAPGGGLCPKPPEKLPA